MKKVLIIIGIILTICISFVAGLFLGRIWQPKPLEQVIKIELLDDEKYGEYEKVTSIKSKNAVSTEVLVKFGGVLYGESAKKIDYAGGVPEIGTIDKLIDSKYVPKLDGETNKKEILGAKVYPSGKNEIVLNYNDVYVLFERIDTTSLSKIEMEQKANEIFGSDYCDINHSIEAGGDALTGWMCKICGQTAINGTTNIPKICNECAKITGRCSQCGKLERK